METQRGTTKREKFYFNSKELQAEIRMLCVIIGALGFCLFQPPSH